MQVQGYVTRVTVDANGAEIAKQFVFAKDAKTVGIRPLWVPAKKIVAAMESDDSSVKIVTAQDGERVGIPFTLDIDDTFLAKVGAI